MQWRLSKDYKREVFHAGFLDEHYETCYSFLLSHNSAIWNYFQQERHQQLDSVEVPCTIWNAFGHPTQPPASTPEWQRSYAVGALSYLWTLWGHIRHPIRAPEMTAGDRTDLRACSAMCNTVLLSQGANSVTNKTVKIFQNFFLALICTFINDPLKDSSFYNIQK